MSSIDLPSALLGDTVGQRELEVLGKELLEVWAADVIGLLDLNDLEDLHRNLLEKPEGLRVQGAYVNRPESGSMAGSHILVEAVHGIGSGQLAVLLVHVVGAGARVISDPDTEVLDLLGALLEDLSID